MAEIELQRVGRVMARIPVEGTAPLIVNKFSAKAMQLMLDKQQGRAVQREHKNPEQLFRDSLHVLPPVDGQDRYGFPATGFKASMVNAARYFKGSKITMTLLKTALFVKGEGGDMLIPLLDADGGFAVPKMREDSVRNATGVADIRFRGEFWPWSATLDVVYVKGLLSLESIVALADAAGLGGVGEWRPDSKESKTGIYGTWRVPDNADITEVTL